jgi:hypothetical protein
MPCETLFEVLRPVLDLPTVHPRVEQATMNTAPAQVAHLVGTRPFPAFLKGSGDSRAVISLSGERNGLLNSAYGRP